MSDIDTEQRSKAEAWAENMLKSTSQEFESFRWNMLKGNHVFSRRVEIGDRVLLTLSAVDRSVTRKSVTGDPATTGQLDWRKLQSTLASLSGEQRADFTQKIVMASEKENAMGGSWRQRDGGTEVATMAAPTEGSGNAPGKHESAHSWRSAWIPSGTATSTDGSAGTSPIPAWRKKDQVPAQPPSRA